MTSATATLDHPVVSSSEWQGIRREFLHKEKELTRLSDELSLQRQALPWTRVEPDYAFTGPQGRIGMSDLFQDRSQLAVYHFMFGPDWEEGCPSCSFVTDHLDGMLEHLHARDVSLVLVSRAPIEKLMAFKQRMGWRMPWVSSSNSTFNRDFAVSFSKEEVASGASLYNFGTLAPYGEENPGVSYFCKDMHGGVFHTYSTYCRGLDVLLGTYAMLDRAPQGRNEAGLPWPMAWVRYHDRYESTLQVMESCCHK